MPCGRSAHTEAGWFCGAGKNVVVYIPCKQEPELMYGLFDGVATTMDEVLECLKDFSYTNRYKNMMAKRKEEY